MLVPRSLRARLLVAFLTVALVPLGALGWLNYHAIRDALIANADATLLSAAGMTAERLDAFINSNLDFVRTQAQNPSLAENLDNMADARARAAARAALVGLGRADPVNISSLALLDVRGNVLVDTHGEDVGVDASAEDYFVQPMATGFPFASPVRFSSGRTGDAGLYFAAPVRDDRGTVRGVLRVRYNAAILQQIIAQASGLAGVQSAATLIDDQLVRLADGEVVNRLFSTVVPLSRDRITALQRARRLDPRAPVQSTNLADLAAGVPRVDRSPFFVFRDENASGGAELRQAAAIRMSTRPWLVVFSQPQDVALAPVNRLFRNFLLLALLFATLVSTGAFFAARRLTIPLAGLTTQVARFTGGDLTARVPVPSGDEIGLLSTAFNEMAGTVEKLVLNLEERTRELEADMAARRRLEEQLVQAQKMEAVGRLAGGIAHDFNNLLTAILANADLAQSGFAPGDVRREEISAIKDAAERAAGLTRQLLAFARKQRIQPTIVDLNALLLNLDRLLRRLIAEDIELVTVPHAGLWLVRVDPTQFEQVIVNLAVNARDAMPRGGRLAIECENVTCPLPHAGPADSDIPPGDYVQLTISDTGSGMSEETLTHIFEPFFTTKDVGQGSGLGLATVYGVVTQAGGYVTAASAPGRGSNFRILLPRASGQLPAATGTTQPPVVRGGRETILLVEDEPLVREVAVRTLRNQGYQVLPAINGSEALAISTSHNEPIHLLLTDVVMPLMNGRELAERVRRQRPEIPVMFMSGYSDDWQQADGPQSRSGFLPKPFSPSELAVRVRVLLDDSR